MPWVKLDDGWYDNPKFLDLDVAAVGLWVIGLTYCARHLTDGHIPSRALGRVCPDFPDEAPAELVARGLWDTAPDGWYVHDYLDYQPPAEKVKADRKKRQDAGSIGGKASAQARAQLSAERSAQANRSTPSRPVPARPGPAKDLAAPAAPRERDELFEAVCSVCSIDWSDIPSTGRGPINKATAALRGVNASPDDVHVRAEHYRGLFPDAALTPMALAKHWAQLATTPTTTGRKANNAAARDSLLGALADVPALEAG